MVAATSAAADVVVVFVVQVIATTASVFCKANYYLRFVHVYVHKCTLSSPFPPLAAQPEVAGSSIN